MLSVFGCNCPTLKEINTMDPGVETRRWKRKKWRNEEQKRTRSPVEDISRHRILFMPPAPFSFQPRSALLTDHCLSSLFSVSASLCSLSPLVPPLLSTVLPQLIILKSPPINRINFLSDAPCRALALLSCFMVFADAAGHFPLWPQ